MFVVSNGVRQGGILFYLLYMDGSNFAEPKMVER